MSVIKLNNQIGTSRLSQSCKSSRFWDSVLKMHDCKMHMTSKNARLWDPWILANILLDQGFLRTIHHSYNFEGHSYILVHWAQHELLRVNQNFVLVSGWFVSCPHFLHIWAVPDDSKRLYSWWWYTCHHFYITKLTTSQGLKS